MFTKLLLVCLGLLVPSLGSQLPYIIGGKDVDSIESYPWQCSMRYEDSTEAHTCGAALISDEWLVTAAHCVTSGDRWVMCGSLDRTTNHGGNIRKVKLIIQHQDYGEGEGAFPNDIAVIKVDPFPLTSSIDPVAFWNNTDGSPSGNSNCYITGWGYTSGSGTVLPRYLQEAHINVYTEEECKRSWGDSINVGHICIGDAAAGKGSCNGDSGGPLVCEKDGVWRLAGVTSWGRFGCSTDYPSVYTKIQYYRSWIGGKTGLY